ncbi:MAG: hypothetical protein AB7F59_04215 [Bdellovibrionales bacterium]
MKTIFLFLFFSLKLSADTNCQTMRNYKDFYRCSIVKHPGFQVAKLKTLEGDAIFERSTQLKNPEIELKDTSGSKLGEKIGTTEIALSVPLSQVWTKGSERAVGKAEQRILEIESKEALMSIKKEVLKDIYRLRQIEEESHLSDDAVSSFEKVVRQLKDRRARGPEQEITLNLVELALGDYELKKNHLAIEKSEILSRVKAIWGPQEEMKKEYLPPLKDQWPSLDEGHIGTGFGVQKLIAESEKADAEQRVVNWASLPELNVGPIAERTIEGPNQHWEYGVLVSMSLPLFSLNSGSRKLAETKAAQARYMSDYAQKKSLVEKSILIQKYKTAVESLRKSSSRKELTRKHEKIDSLFRQGLAAGGIVIEAHRQITEFTESQHEHEMLALDSYVEIMSLAGKDVEGIL